MMGSRHRHWRVVVETSGEHIVSIEPEMLSGREISDADENSIRTAAHHLLAFIGDPHPETHVENADLLEVAKEAFSTLKLASRQLTEDHRMVLMGRAWGWRTLAKLEGVIAKATRT